MRIQILILGFKGLISMASLVSVLMRFDCTYIWLEKMITVSVTDPSSDTLYEHRRLLFLIFPLFLIP